MVEEVETWEHSNIGPSLNGDIIAVIKKSILMYIFFIERQKKNAQKVWSKDLVYKKNPRLSSHIPDQFNVMSRTI